MKIFNFKYLILVFVGILILPKVVLGANLSFKVVSNNVSNDNSAIIEVRIDPDSKNLNVIEGIIAVKGIGEGNSSSVIVETGGSVMTLWTVPPKYYANDKVIRFTGGVPQGFEKEGLLFRIRLSDQNTSNVTLSWIGGVAYLNDGIGTKENIYARSISLNLSGQETKPISNYSFDNTPPYFSTIELGKDLALYDGKYFLSFSAVDDVSGIARYEVVEGQKITHSVQGLYVLKDQNRKNSILVTVYDNAGNSETIEFPSKYAWVKSLVMFVILVLILGAILLVYKKSRSK
jgi:hypothetical protein